MSNHYGEGAPTITNGFDRTFGPQYYLFNGGKDSKSPDQLRSEAESLADPHWTAEFYDSIAKHVVGYAPSFQRGSVEVKIKLPKGAVNPVAALTVDGQYFQDTSVNPSSHQYWTDIDCHGKFSIDRIKEGQYRLTVYAEGIFGDFVRDVITVQSGKTTEIHEKWIEESAGTEVWRLGSPDKSSGEFRRGNARDPTHPLNRPKYRFYWGECDWQQDFPNDTNYTIGSSDPALDFNTVHWSVFGPTAESPHVEYDKTHDWAVNFVLDKKQLKGMNTATLTSQLAGAKTASGNTDEYKPNEPCSNLVLEGYINQQAEPLTMLTGYDQSSSCILRSAVTCY